MPCILLGIVAATLAGLAAASDAWFVFALCVVLVLHPIAFVGVAVIRR